MTEATGDADTAPLRSAIEASLDADGALSTLGLLERLWRGRPGPSTAGFVLTRAQRLTGIVPRRTVKLAIARSFTVEPVIPLLRAAAVVHRVELDVVVRGFGTYAQDLLDPVGGIGGDDADVVIVALQTRDVAPELWASMSDDADYRRVCDRVVTEVGAMLSAFRKRSGAHVLVHALEEPVRPALGGADAHDELGQVDAVRAINAGLRELAREHSAVHILDYDRIVADVGRSRWYDEAKWGAMRMSLRPEAMAALANAWVRHLFPMLGVSAKAIVVDLDNTLWGGVVGEAGPTGILLGETGSGAGFRALQRSLLDLRSRGVLLAVCSKNNLDDAMQVLSDHPSMLIRPHHFAATRINWDNKADNIRSIAAELNIGLDAVAFLDDNPAECELIRQELPAVTVIELDRPPTVGAHPLLDHPLFERLALSAEDRRRNEMYAEQRERKELEASVGSLDDYLASLGTVVEVSLATVSDVPRVAQLTQKTNQFNLTTRRYTEADIEQMLASEDVSVYCARAADRFGDHGLIGVAIVSRRTGTPEIDSFLLSCRVIGRGVETAVLTVIAEDCRAAESAQLIGCFIPSAKNAPAVSFLPDHGFVLSADESGLENEHRHVLDLTEARLTAPPWITLRTSSRSNR
jgi:FkbH-like protein